MRLARGVQRRREKPGGELRVWKKATALIADDRCSFAGPHWGREFLLMLIAILLLTTAARWSEEVCAAGTKRWYVA